MAARPQSEVNEVGGPIPRDGIEYLTSSFESLFVGFISNILNGTYLSLSPDSFEHFTSIIEDQNNILKETRMLMESHTQVDLNFLNLDLNLKVSVS